MPCNYCNYNDITSFIGYSNKASLGMVSWAMIPVIEDVFYNEPHTAVKWSDGTTTVVGCAEGEEFSKELGLSVAIAKKYFECLGAPYPRAALKAFAEHGHDQTAKTKARKDFKASKKNKKAE